MPKMRGLLHTGPKITEEEMALAEARMAARLAELFGGSATRSDAGAAPGGSADDDLGGDSAGPDATPGSDPQTPGPRRAGPRPVIIVEGAGDSAGAEPTREKPPLVGVMARSGEDAGDDAWALPEAGAGRLAMDSDAHRPAAAGEPDIATTADPGSPDSGNRKPKRVDRAASPHRASGKTATPARTARPASIDSGAARKPGKKVRPTATPSAFCPYCAVVLEPPPTSSGRCLRCRQRIRVKRIHGRAIYLTDAAVVVFEAERRREASSGRLDRERGRWLRLAATAGAPAARAERLASGPLTESAVNASRALYVLAVNRAFRAARRDRDWSAASRIRRAHATTLYRIAGSRVPPAQDIVAIYREGISAELRGIAEVSREAQLTTARCCDVCRADNGRTVRIVDELRVPLLPHQGCPRGLCRCAWGLAERDRAALGKYLKRPQRTSPRAVSTGAARLD